MHGQDATGDKLSVLPDGKMPRLDSHQVIKGKLQYQTTLCTNLDKDHKLGVILHSSLDVISLSEIFNQLADNNQLIWTVFIGPT